MRKLWWLWFVLMYLAGGISVWLIAGKVNAQAMDNDVHNFSTHEIRDYTYDQGLLSIEYVIPDTRVWKDELYFRKDITFITGKSRYLPLKDYSRLEVRFYDYFSGDLLGEAHVNKEQLKDVHWFSADLTTIDTYVEYYWFMGLDDMPDESVSWEQIHLKKGESYTLPHVPGMARNLSVEIKSYNAVEVLVSSDPSRVTEGMEESGWFKPEMGPYEKRIVCKSPLAWETVFVLTAHDDCTLEYSLSWEM